MSDVAVPSEIKLVDIDDLILFDRNSRTHGDEQVQQIADSIVEFGFTNPILIDESNQIIAGHGRLAAAKKLGMSTVPCVALSHLSDDQRRAYVIADNKLALNAGWDEEILALELGELKELGFDLSLTGFDHDELAGLVLDEEGFEGLTDENAAPEIQEKATSRMGDVWQLGKHKLMCGDSTETQDFASLMGEALADLIFTDPPYGMSYGGGRGPIGTSDGTVKSHGMIMNDDLQEDDLVGLVRDALNTVSSLTKDGAALYVCFTWRTYAEFEKAIGQCGKEIKGCIVWDKKSVGLGSSNYRPQHEFIFYCGGQWYGDKAQSDVWSMSRGAVAKYVHPTQKPVELIEKALENSSKQGDIVADCFGGSGSTLIACEKTGRSARLMELDPKYVDVIVRRWQEFTGKSARHIDLDLTFEEVEKERMSGAA